MKKYTFVIFLSFCTIIIYFTLMLNRFIKDIGDPVKINNINQSQKDTVDSPISKTIKHKDVVYDYRLVAAPENATVMLVDNFDQQLSSNEIIKQNQCDVFINGGFYTKDFNPIGLFINGNIDMSRIRPNSIYNGIVGIEDNTVEIYGLNDPIVYDSGFQTGPILANSGELLEISLSKDEQARRMFLIKAVDKKTLLGSVYSSDTSFSGPYLADLPELINKIAIKESFEISSAINLDGGSASSFSDSQIKISELTPIGSALCYNKSDKNE